MLRKSPELETLKSRAGSPRPGEPLGWFPTLQGLLINRDGDGFSLSGCLSPPNRRFHGTSFPGSLGGGDKNSALESCLSSLRFSHTPFPYLPICLSALSHRHTGNHPRRTGLLMTNPPHPHTDETASTGRQLCPGTEEGQGQGAQLGTRCFRAPRAVSAGEEPDGGCTGGEGPQTPPYLLWEGRQRCLVPDTKHFTFSEATPFPGGSPAPAESTPGQVLGLGQFPNPQRLPLPPLAASFLSLLSRSLC